jgi:hypothetical protein
MRMPQLMLQVALASCGGEVAGESVGAGPPTSADAAARSPKDAGVPCTRQGDIWSCLDPVADAFGGGLPQCPPGTNEQPPGIDPSQVACHPETDPVSCFNCSSNGVGFEWNCVGQPRWIFNGDVWSCTP